MNEKLLDPEALSERCRALQQQGRRIVLTNGCFDLLHVGHIRYLKQARELGDALVVALNDDASVRALKGRTRPIVPAAQRGEVLAALACVDYVTIFEDETAAEAVRTIRPQIYVKGGDYVACRLAVPEAETVAEYGGTVFFLDLHPDASTTGIIETILRREREGLLSPLATAAATEAWQP